MTTWEHHYLRFETCVYNLPDVASVMEASRLARNLAMQSSTYHTSSSFKSSVYSIELLQYSVLSVQDPAFRLNCSWSDTTARLCAWVCAGVEVSVWVHRQGC